MTGALLLALTVAARPPANDSVLTRAESLLVSGHLVEARAILERMSAQEPRNTRALILLGRVFLAWPTIGRYKAWALFEQAAALDPTAPEPLYRQAAVGEYLGGDDGEAMERRALIRLFAVDPDYRDAWARWRELYRNDGQRTQALTALGRHAGNMVADLHRAELAIELDSSALAERLLGSQIAAGLGGRGAWALRAEARLERGDAAGGLADYDSAVAHAALDTAGYLWWQVRGIASPDEGQRYHAIAPDQRPDFVREFWSRRDPDLFTGANERILEHFERLHESRTQYHLLHPMSYFHRSSGWRALAGMNVDSVLLGLREFGLPGGVIPGRSALEDSVQMAGVGVSVRDLPEPDTVTRYRDLGLDGRGLIYLRFGEPRQRFIGTHGDVESWVYDVDGHSVNVTFARSATAFGFGGDMVVYPTSSRELRNSELMLERDATSIPADLPVAAWVASFRGGDPGAIDVYIRATPDTVAAVLWNAHWRMAARTVGVGPLMLNVPAGGRYFMGLDARSGSVLGRVRDTVAIPRYTTGVFAISSLLIGNVRDSAYTRDDVVAGMSGDLVVRPGPVAVYAEVYDAPRDRLGVARYDVEYLFQRLDGAGEMHFAFSRDAVARSMLVERLTVARDRIPPGRYRVTLTIHDRVFGIQASNTRTEVQLR